MAEINCWGSDDPIEVAKGGSGVASHTAYAVLCGGTTTTGAVQSIAGVGTSGQVLTSNGAASLPTFQAASGGFGEWTDIANSAASGATVSFTSGLGTAYDDYLIIFDGISCSASLQDLDVAFSDDGGSTYTLPMYIGAQGDMEDRAGATPWAYIGSPDDAANLFWGFIMFGGNNTGRNKYLQAAWGSDDAGQAEADGKGLIETANDIDAVQFSVNGAGTYDAGTFYLLGR